MIDAVLDDPPAKPTTLEGVLAEQANEAIKAGVDPKQATDMLGTMVRHVRANPTVAQQGYEAYTQGIDPGAIAAHVWQMAKPAERAPLLSRVADQAGGFIKQAVTHPLDTAAGLIEAPVKSAITTMSPGVGQARTSAALSKGGNSSGRPIDVSPYDAEHGGVTSGERTAAGIQTLTNIAAPGIAKGVTKLAGGGLLAKLAGTSAAGSAASAAYSPDDPLAGAITGGLLAPAIHGAAKVIKPIASFVGGKAVDVAGRPTENVGPIEGVNERAARLNTDAMKGVEIPFMSTKPLAPVDLGGVPAQRLARGLKTSSPAAETVFRDALQPRAEGAVDRVIQHGLETTGLTSRENGLGVVDDMIAQRGQEAAGRYPKTFAKYPNPIDDPEFDAVAKTPAGQQALKRGMTIAKNRGENMAEVDLGGGTPLGYSPEQWQHITETMKARGLPVPDVPGGETRIAPTLQQAHYIKLGFDDMLNSAPEPGSGGSGPNNAAAIRGLKNRWLAAMDKASPEYASDRKTYADQSDLVRGAELGRNLFKMHPQEAAKALAELPQAAQDVARRTGFDALSERIENGPTDVDKGLKVRDRQRMRLLFPDDESFEKFREGLKQEAQMHATNQGVLSGSVTADKLSDMADLAGVTLPDVLHAASGRVMPLLSKVARKVTVGKASVDAVNAERARLLVAGAGGSAADRVIALRKMGVTPEVGGAQQNQPSPMLRLPAGRFVSGDAQQGSALPTGYYRGEAGDFQQGSAMPTVPTPLSRRLNSGPPIGVPTVGVNQHGPIQAPNRLLASGGPAAVPTETGALHGPAIPMGGKGLEAAVQEELTRLYRTRPLLAMSMTPDQVRALEKQVRARIASGR